MQRAARRAAPGDGSISRGRRILFFFFALAQASGRRHLGEDEMDGVQRDRGPDGGGSSLNIGPQSSPTPAASLGTWNRPSRLDGPQEKEVEPARAMSSKLQNFPAHHLCVQLRSVFTICL